MFLYFLVSYAATLNLCFSITFLNIRTSCVSFVFFRLRLYFCCVLYVIRNFSFCTIFLLTCHLFIHLPISELPLRTKKSQHLLDVFTNTRKLSLHVMKFCGPDTQAEFTFDHHQFIEQKRVFLFLSSAFHFHFIEIFFFLFLPSTSLIFQSRWLLCNHFKNVLSSLSISW